MTPKFRSNSELLKKKKVKAAIAADTHIESLARKFDEAHLRAEQIPNQETKRAKMKAKQELTNAVEAHQLELA